MKYAYNYSPKNASFLGRNICENSFSKWSNHNMYRTSYTNTFTPVIGLKFRFYFPRSHCHQKTR